MLLFGASAAQAAELADPQVVVLEVNERARALHALIREHYHEHPLLQPFGDTHLGQGPENREELQRYLDHCDAPCAPWSEAGIRYRTWWLGHPDQRQKFELVVSFVEHPCQARASQEPLSTEFYLPSLGLYADVLVRHTDWNSRRLPGSTLELELLRMIGGYLRRTGGQEITPLPAACAAAE